jgi:iron complex outermembrane receptor protein
MGYFGRSSILATLAFSLASPLISAQEVGEASVGALQEIVVTAQKRPERPQDVPATIEAFDSNALATKNVSDLVSLQYLTPSVDIGTAEGPGKFRFAALE